MARSYDLLRFVILVAASSVGCAAEDADPQKAAPDNSAADFAMSPTGRDISILPAIESSGGRIEVCLGLIGFTPEARGPAAAKLEALVTDTAQQWNALLVENPDWPVKMAIAPSFVVSDRECPIRLAGFAVNLWATPALFRSDYCARPGYTCSSGAISTYRTLYLGPWNRDREVDPFTPFTTLHEYGHLLGLGDTYRIAGANDWVGDQPPSVMSGRSGTLTNDDKLGLWATLRAVRTGVRSCEGFGNDVQMTANAWNAVMCNPAATPTIDHSGL